VTGHYILSCWQHRVGRQLHIPLLASLSGRGDRARCFFRLAASV